MIKKYNNIILCIVCVKFILHIHIFSFYFSNDSYSNRLQNCRRIGLMSTFLPDDYVNLKPIHPYQSTSFSVSLNPLALKYINKQNTQSRGEDHFASNISVNDIFRFGSGRNDRFLSIFERVDKDNTILQSFVHFVGFEASLYKMYNYSSMFYCSFFHERPLNILPSPPYESVLTIVHERRLHGYDNEIMCKIPKQYISCREPLYLSLGMIRKHSLLNISSFPEESGPRSSSAVHSTLSQSLSLLLPIVRLPRAEVDRIRRFNVSMSTMVKN